MCCDLPFPVVGQELGFKLWGLRVKNKLESKTELEKQ